ncbi:MAG: hypothetical protein ACREGJ_04605 [Candidatus Saccharimonadales bacterium]
MCGRVVLKITLQVVVLSLFLPATALAIDSPNYRIQEDFIGGSGRPQSSSTNYQSRDSAGANAVGDGTGTNYRSQSGATTADEPRLEFGITSSSVNLGSLSASLTRTGTATFNVLNYTSYGYIVQVIGQPPDNGAHTLTGMSTAGSSTIGTEQFGINLVANTAPESFGANPAQVPDSTFGFGVAASGYNTANTYKYVSGNTIASAPKSSGQTDYTISYIANISNDTPGGSYSGTQTLICVGTY